jgi:AraC family transcriptional regulator
MAIPAWHKVKREIGHSPVVAGRIGGSAPLFLERYVHHETEIALSGLNCTALAVQLGGGTIYEGPPDEWRSVHLPTQAVLLPRGVATHWYYSGSADVVGFYFLDGGGEVSRALEQLARSKGKVLPFSDPLVGAAARQLANEVQKGLSADQGFLERLAGVMIEQAFRALTTPNLGEINPRHIHFPRLQTILGFVHNHLSEDLSVANLAARADVSLAHFCRIFRDAMGVAPHQYVRATRVDLARRLLTQSTLPISRIAQECGFSSQSHLTATFQSLHALTPARYRAHFRMVEVFPTGTSKATPRR